MAALVKGVPVLPVEDMQATVSFYTQKLGFNVDFEHDGYVGLKRDSVEVHFSNVPGDLARTLASQTMCRFIVDDVDKLYEEYSQHENVIHPNGKLQDKSWGTREFGVLDPAGVCLTFYRD